MQSNDRQEPAETGSPDLHHDQTEHGHEPSMAPEPKQTVVCPRPDHCISRRNIDPDALTVLYRLSRNGYIAHLVGGGVRDLLLGREPKDFDVSTDANPRQIKRLFRNCFLIGRRFRLAHIRFDSKVIETSTFRCQPDLCANPDDPDADLYRRTDNEFGTPAEDAHRRDFTINGLFYDIKTFSVIDHVGGLEDLDRRVIRSIGDPNIRFREDPVRMLRAIRFASRLDFTIEPETFEAIARHRHDILKASPPRLLEEVYRLFAFKSGQPAMKLLRETGLMEVLFPEQNRYLDTHPGLRFWNLLAGLDGGEHVVGEPVPALIFAALFYPMFKERMDKALRDGDKVSHAEMAHRLLAPLVERFVVPKAVFAKLIHMFQGQQRLEPSKRQRVSKTRFLAQESFPETLALRQIATQAGYGDPDSVIPWVEAYEERLASRPSRDEYEDDRPARPDRDDRLQARPPREEPEPSRQLREEPELSRPSREERAPSRPPREDRSEPRPARRSIFGLSPHLDNEPDADLPEEATGARDVILEPRDCSQPGSQAGPDDTPDGQKRRRRHRGGRRRNRARPAETQAA
jgi:poly(A) polymerase